MIAKLRTNATSTLKVTEKGKEKNTIFSRSETFL